MIPSTKEKTDDMRTRPPAKSMMGFSKAEEDSNISAKGVL